MQRSALPLDRNPPHAVFPASGKLLAWAAGFVVVFLTIYALFFRSTTKPLPSPPIPIVTPTLAAVPSPPANPPKTIEQLNLTGQWELTNRIVTTSYTPYRGLKLGYDLTLEQRGTVVTGKGEKVSENDRTIFANARTPISLNGNLSGRQLTLSFVEYGVKRSTKGTFQLTVNEEGTAWTGTFMQTAANTRGETVARKKTSLKRE